MSGEASPSELATDPGPPAGASTRELVEFYLLDHRTRLGQAIDVALLSLNALFVAVYVVQTYRLSAVLESLLWDIEVALALVFLLEYVLRLYGAPDRLDEVTNGYTIADLLSILPTFAVLLLPAPLAGAIGLGFLRALRAVRFLRFYRFTRDEEFFFGTVTVETLRVLRLSLTILTIFFVTGGLFYEVEAPVNPDVSTFGDGFYYMVITLTTVGFGDIVPTTPAGRWVTMAGLAVALVLVPWQAGRIIREWTAREQVNVTCPNCGLEYHDPDASHCKACGHVIYQEYDSRE
jgi:voltage-gated potassium channel